MKEYLRSKRLAEAKDTILFPRVYDTAPRALIIIAQVCLGTQYDIQQTQNVEGYLLCSLEGNIVPYAQVVFHPTNRTECSTERNKLFEILLSSL